MQDTFELVIDYLRNIWRYRWYAMVVAWVVILVGWEIVINYKPVTYTASAKVYVDTQTVLKPLLKGLALEKDSGIYIGLMVRQLVSRTNLEQVAHDIGLDQDVKAGQNLENFYTGLERKVRVDGSRVTSGSSQSDYFAISYSDTNPLRAKKVVQALIDSFADKTVGESLRDSKAAKQFLEQQIEQQKVEVDAAESRIAEFKRNHLNVLPEQGNGYFQRLQAAQAAVDDVDLQISEAKYRRNALREQLKDTPETVKGSPDTRTVPNERGSRIATLQARLDELLLKFTEQHPDVIAARRNIDEIMKQGGTTRNEVVSNSFIPNPVYQQLKIAFGQVESEISALQVRKTVFMHRVQQLQDRREPLTQAEAELQKLNQDYGSEKKKLDALLGRLGPADLAGSVEQAGEDVRFRVIDQVRVQEAWTDVAKNRVALTTMVLIAGVGGGVGLAFLLSQISPVVYGRRIPTELTGLPVFAVVSLMMTRQRRWRMRLDITAFVVISVILVSAHVIALYLELAKYREILQGIGGAG